MRLTLLIAALTLTASCNERTSQSSAPPERKAAPAAEPAPEPARPAVRCQPGERTCFNDHVVQCKADGSLGDQLQACNGVCRDGACVDTCALQDVELIYAVDSGATLYAFDPKKLPADPFRKVAALQCDASRSVNSMAVDRVGIAWLGYQNGKVHRASIIDGRCSEAGAAPRNSPRTFGMGFVTDGPKATTEKLFVASSEDGSNVKRLAILETTELPATWKPFGAFEAEGYHPELTGTGDGRLFAYFPAPGRGAIQELDRTTGKPVGKRWVLEDKDVHVSAYAFAHWGGVFYVFTTANEVSSVHAVHMSTGKQERVVTDLPMRIVGAGVSTCAPLLEKVP